MIRSLPFALWASCATIAAQEPFPEPYNSEPDPAATPPSAEEAVKLFQLPEGFEATVFAAEPDVQNPIEMAWDWRGRMWVAENYTYAEKARRFDFSLRDRVLIFEDTDWDGKADKRAVFTDNVQMLTSVEVGHGGVWLMCPPQLLFVPDADGDDVPDGEPVVMLDGFTVAKNNYHNFANGLRWGPDGWLYGRCGGSCPGELGVPGTPPENRIPIHGGIWRFHPVTKQVEVLCHGTVNPWGHDWDEFGELFFINTVGGHFWHMIPGAHYVKPFGVSPNPLAFERIEMHADHWHFDTSGHWMDSRDGAANDFGGGHAHVGMTIYQARQLPERFRGKLMTWNMHGRRANVERLEREGSGYVAKHEPDILLTGDEWFRGIEISTGPDGSLFAIDWSDTGECHEHTGVHRQSGRIYRFSHGAPAKPELSDLADLSGSGAVRLVKTPNVWFSRQLQRRIIDLELEDHRTRDEKGAPTPKMAALNKELRAALVAIIESTDEDPVHRFRAWSAYSSREIPRDWMTDENEYLRAWAIRTAAQWREREYPLDTVVGSRPAGAIGSIQDMRVSGFWYSLATKAEEEESQLVRLAIASMMMRMPHDGRAAVAKALAGHAEDANDQNLPKMVWFGVLPLAGSDPDALVEIAAASEWPDLTRWIARALAIDIENLASPVEALLELALDDPDKAPAVLAGLSEGFRGWRKAPKPANWDRFAKAFADSPDVRDLSALFGDGRAMDQLKAIALDEDAELATRQTALRTLIDSDAPGLRELCQQLLTARKLNMTAVRGLAGFEDPDIGKMLAENYRKFFWPQERAPVIDVLCSRPEWAAAMLSNVGDDRIPQADITPFHARQIRAFDDETLTNQLSRIWGEVRQSDEAKRAQIEALKKRLTPEVIAEANLGAGRLLNTALCSSCHKLYGEGGDLGPDLTGSGRLELEYLLENIVDPSAVVSTNYRMTTITLEDGGLHTGVVSSETGRTLTLRLLNEEIVIDQSRIAKREDLPTSIMPEGLLGALEPDQVRDLLAYLMHPRQVPLP